jgi:hypothetical protein
MIAILIIEIEERKKCSSALEKPIEFQNRSTGNFMQKDDVQTSQLSNEGINNMHSRRFHFISLE